MATATRTIVLKQGGFTAGIEDGAFVIEGPGVAGELTRARLPADLEWLSQWLSFVQDAGDALARHYEGQRVGSKAGRRGHG